MCVYIKNNLLRQSKIIIMSKYFLLNHLKEPTTYD